MATSYEQLTQVVCFTNIKQAALYFDKVVPICLATSPSLADSDPQFRFELLGSLLYGQNMNPTHFSEACRLFVNFHRKAQIDITDNTALQNDLMKVFQDPNSIGEAHFNVLYAHNAKLHQGGNFRGLVSQLCEKCGCEEQITILLPEKHLKNEETTEAALTATFGNFPAIEPEKPEWEQILEIRRDAVSMSKLRNLRLFLHENYSAKSRAFIEDDLGRRLQDYHKACKDHGLKTRLSTFSTVIESKSSLACAIATTTAILTGEPLATSVAAATAAGVALEIGKVGLTVTRSKHSLDIFKRDHELAYIIDLQKRLTKN